MKDILIIEDNEEIANLLCDFLQAEGYTSQTFDNGEEGLAFFCREDAKLVVLDIMLPGIDGFAICEQIRKQNNTPILMVSARISKEDKLNGLILGADDYIEKPYDIDILLAKIHGIFKRRYEIDRITCGNIQLDVKRHVVYQDAAEIKMTIKEFELLKLLLENSGKTLTKEWIFSQIWGMDSDSEFQTLTVHIKWLREKIGSEHIRTVWGVGYRFEE